MARTLRRPISQLMGEILVLYNLKNVREVELHIAELKKETKLLELLVVAYMADCK